MRRYALVVLLGTVLAVCSAPVRSQRQGWPAPDADAPLVQDTVSVHREPVLSHQMEYEPSSEDDQGFAELSPPQAPGTLPLEEQYRRGVLVATWIEQWFDRLDRNGDGLLNSDEMPASLRAQLDRWDVNQD